jgi:TRAP-type mannitol/chloroaromatic compound transport system substrate-binding protein
MDRRDFLKSTGGLAAAVATGCAASTVPAAAAWVDVTAGEPRKLTLATPWSQNSAGCADDAHRLARQIEMACSGSIVFTIEPNSAGRADATVGLVKSAPSRHPAFAYFSGLPSPDALAPRDLDAWLTAGGGQELWDDLAAAHGVKPFLAGHTGSSPVLWSRTRLTKPQDFAGLTIVARGIDAEVVRALGAVAVDGDEAALAEQIADGGIDAAMWGGLIHASAAGIPAHLPYGVRGALGSAGAAIALEIDLAVWDTLLPSQQTAMAAASGSHFRAWIADAMATEQAVEQAVTTRFAAVIEPPSARIAAAVSRIAAAVVAHTAAQNTASVQIDGSYSAFRRAMIAPIA